MLFLKMNSQHRFLKQALVGFNELWYKNYPKSNFHFVNDNSSWLQMDKFGHAATSYYGGVIRRKPI